MSVSIVVPVYRTGMSESEAAALKQCKSVLHKYEIQLVAPDSLDVTAHLAILGKATRVVRFPNKYFHSIRGYSKLLVSDDFYRSFQSFEYILIYQLDAWVFADELKLWTNRGYDYIGAPWLKAPPVRKSQFPMLSVSGFLKNKVGNGGFSLRKVRTHVKWSPWARFVFAFFPKNEDVIWSLFVPMKRPSAGEALRFAFEMDPGDSYKLTGGQLPFGCHAWEKYDPGFWKPFINIGQFDG